MENKDIKSVKKKDLKSILSFLLLILSVIFAHFYGIVDLDYFSTQEYKLFNALSRLAGAVPSKDNGHTILVGFDIASQLSLNCVSQNITFVDSRTVKQDDEKSQSVAETLKSKVRVYFERDSFGVISVTESEFNEIYNYVKTKVFTRSVGGVAAEYALAWQSFKPVITIGGNYQTEHSQLLNGKREITHLKECNKGREADLQISLEWSPRDEMFTIHRSEMPRRGNRVLVLPKVSEPDQKCWDAFFQHLKSKSVDLVVIGGLSFLQYFEESDQKKFLLKIEQHLRAVEDTTPVHLEIGDANSEVFLKNLAEHVFPHVNSIGVGERTILALYKAVLEPGFDLSADSGIAVAGGVAIINDILYGVLSKFGESRSPYRLSRMFFHSYAFHVTAIRKLKWETIEASMAAASLHVSKGACNVKTSLDLVNKRLAMPSYFTLSKSESEIVAALDVNFPVTKWAKKDVQFYITPVSVCDDPTLVRDHGVSASAMALISTQFVEEKFTNEESDVNSDDL